MLDVLGHRVGFAAGLTFLIFAVARDVFSTVLVTRRLLRGYGPSGLHGLASGVYPFAGRARAAAATSIGKHQPGIH
jgi:hypothetical protein